MNITILALGSRGDVQPYLALGLGLQARGHQVTLAAVEYFRQFVEENGLGFHPVAGNVFAMLNSQAALAAMESGLNTFKAIRDIFEMSVPFLEPLADDCLAACQDADLILTSTLASVGFPIGQALQIPVMPALPYPLINPTGAVPSPVWPVPVSLGPLYNRLTHTAAMQLSWQIARPFLNSWAVSRLGLAPYAAPGPLMHHHRSRGHVLYGFSPSVLPPPRDWGPHLHVTGYWFLGRQAAWQPPQPLTDFLAAGPPPVYVGFGSMILRDPAQTTRLIVEALRLTGQRAVLLRGWAGLPAEDLPPSVYVVENVPHDWLFPQMAAVVHHGGAGTTAAGLRAGVPTIITPFFLDQSFWGRLVYKHGVGPRPVLHRALTAQKLAQAMDAAVNAPIMRRRAAELGQAIRREDGVARAADVIEQHFGSLHQGRAIPHPDLAYEG